MVGSEPGEPGPVGRIVIASRLASHWGPSPHTPTAYFHARARAHTHTRKKKKNLYRTSSGPVASDRGVFARTPSAGGKDEGAVMMSAEGPRVTSVHTLPAIQVDVPQEHHLPHPHPHQHYPHRTRPPYGARRSVSSYSTTAPASGSGPMAIPNGRDHHQHSPPPPLPPPRHLVDPDLAVRYGRERGEDPKTLPPIRPGSSLLAGLGRSSSTDDPPGPALVRRPRRTSALNDRSSGDQPGERTQQQQHQQQQQQQHYQDEGYASLPSSGPNMHKGYVE